MFEDKMNFMIVIDGVKTLIEIRPLRAEDYESLTNDLNPWNYKKKGIAYFEWLAGYRPSDNLSMVAVLNHRVIGYYGTIPVPLKVGDHTVTAYRGGVFVDPDHRKKKYNLMNLLVRAVHSEAEKRKGAIYGFPTLKLVKYYTRRIEGALLKPIDRQVYSSRTPYFFKRLLRSWSSHEDRSSPVLVKKIDHFDDRFDALWEKASSKRPILSVRKKDYLNWRYFKEPGVRYDVFAAEKEGTLQGYIVLKVSVSSEEKNGQVIDLFDTREPGVTRALLTQAIDHFKKEEVDRTEAYLSDDFYENHFKSIGFAKLAGRPEEAECLVAKHYSPDIADSLFYNSGNWFLTKTDMLFA